MAKISENRIPDIYADWGLDEKNGLPYSGEAVQEFIKDTLKSKFGYIHYDEIGSRYMVFADQKSYKLYDEDKEANKDLLLTVFNAPFNYSARIELLSEAYNAVLLGSTGNILKFKFFLENKEGYSTEENADCTITFTNGGVKKTLNQIYTSAQGREGVSIDLQDYITEGTNNISIVIKGQDNLASTTVSVIYQVVNLQVSDTFDLSKTYNIGDTLIIPLTVGGYGSKTIEWYLDGERLPFDTSIDQINSPITVTNTKAIQLENITPGVHSIQVRAYTIVEGKQFYSQTLFRNFFVKGGAETLVGVASELPIGIEPIKGKYLDRVYGLVQYVPYTLRYAIYNPANLSSNSLSVYIESELYLTTNVTNDSESTISLVVNKSGNHNIKIAVNGTIYNIDSNVEQSSINIYEIDSNLSLDLRAFGRVNEPNEENNAVWTYKDITSDFSGFYWNAQSGWIDNSLIVNAGATLTIDHAPLATNVVESGKTMEFEFATRNVINDDSVVLDLMDDNGVGLLIRASEVIMAASDGSVVSTKFKSGDTNRISLVINKNANDTNACLMCIYVNGIICGVTNYAKTANIICENKLAFNSDVDVIIKQLRFYDKALTSDEILNNYILYRDDVSEMLDIYKRNDIYDALSEIDPEKIVNWLPVMYFTCLLNDPKNTVLGGIPTLEARTDADAKDDEIYCSIKYVNAQDPDKNFSIDRSRVRLQGTSSIKYPKKNWRFYTGKKYGVMLDHKGNVIPDGKYSFKTGSIPTDRWCLKADYAESSSSHNTGTARIWNELLTKAQVTYSNPEKSSYFMLQGIKEDGSAINIYTFYDKDNEKLNEVAIMEQKFEKYTYVPTTRAFVIETELSSKAIPVAELPDDSDNGFRSNLFIMLPDKNGVVGEYALMTNAQRLAKENGYDYDVRTCIDGFPIVVFYRLTENDPWIFLGKHNFNNEKSSENVFGFCDIPGFDDAVIPGSVTEENPEGYTYGEKMQCWELLNNNDALGFFTTTEGFYDLVPDGKGGQIYRWEQAFEARYPDEGSAAPTGDLKRFGDWMSTVSKEAFVDEKWDHLDVYKMAAYYIYLMRFGAADQVVKNSMFTSEDGNHFYFINYDNDTILGVKNDGRLVFDPTIDRQTPDPDFPDAYAYAGHDSRLWNMLEDDKEFMDIVKAVDSALGSAGMTYEAMIDMFENKQTGQWCERIYNRDAQLKYINPYNTGVYDEGLFSLQGTRNSHRRWWLSQRFNIYDAKFITGSFKTQNIWFKLNGAPMYSYFEVTSGKNLPYGYEITNGASEVTDFIPVDDVYRFVIPQGVSVGDPVLIYGATNIKKLDMSNVIPYLSQISLAGAYSDSVGSLLEELDFHGNNVASNVTISGLEYLTSLKKIDIQGIQGIKELSLPNSLNLKTLLAKNSGLTSVDLAPGCLIERLELPTSTAAVILKDLPLLTSENLILDGDWMNVRQIEISGCPNLTNDFNLIWNWYQNSSNVKNRSLELHGINWTNVNIDDLIELASNVNIILKGKIRLQAVAQEDRKKLIQLKSALKSDTIYNKDSDLYVTGVSAIYLFGPERVLEGEDPIKFETIVFSEQEGQLVFRILNTETRNGVTLDEELGIFTTIETGDPSLNYTVRAGYLINGGLLTDDITFLVEKRTYPENIIITGSNKIDTELSEFTWTSLTAGVNGMYRAEWELKGDILNFAEIISSTSTKCVIQRYNIPDNLATGILSINLYKEYNGDLIPSTSMNISIVNPNVIMTSESNPEAMAFFYNLGKTESSEYMLKSEAEAITNEDLKHPESNFKGLFSNSGIKTFDEFEYFTGITTIPAFCFQNLKMTSIKLPKSITRIEEKAFDNTALTSIELGGRINYIHVDAFINSSYLTNINVVDNIIYNSHEGCVYQNWRDKLCFIAPGLTEYVMPEDTNSIYGDGSDVFKNAKMLRKLTLNNKVNIDAKMFRYGFKYLTEFAFSPERTDYVIYNGSIYTPDYSVLVHYPSGRTFDESDLHPDTKEFGERALTYNYSLVDFEIPQQIVKVGTWCITSCLNLVRLVVHENCSIGDDAFAWNSKLREVILNTSKFDGDYIFTSCYDLTNVVFNGAPTRIPMYMFSSCQDLETLVIPESVTSIDHSAFEYCSKLSELVIPKNVTSIGNGCFKGCYLLEELVCLPTSAPRLGQNVFGQEFDNSGNPGYVGRDVKTTKYLRTQVGSTGYDSGDWKDVLQDKAGFIHDNTGNV